MRDFKIFAAMADLHIGVKHIEAKELKKQLKKHFITPLKGMKYLDGIFICGDIMHTIVSLNSDYSELFHWFIDQIYKIAKSKGSTVIILKGTISHDNDQLSNLKSYINNDDGVDFRIYETIEETIIWDDYKVLILPDVRVKQLKEIDKYLDKGDYDLILGHGLIDRMEFFVQNMENMPTKTYVYNLDKLIDASNGPIIFGHIHQFQHFRHKFYYTGPFTLLERGGIDGGYLVGGIYDKDHHKFHIEHYVNPDSAEYYDIRVTKDILNSFSIDDIIENIDAIVADAKENDLFTLRIVRGDEADSSDKVMMLESRYRKDRRFTIVKKIKTKREEERDREIKEKKERYNYIMDENLTVGEILYRYYTNDVAPTLDTNKRVIVTKEEFDKILTSIGIEV